MRSLVLSSLLLLSSAARADETLTLDGEVPTDDDLRFVEVPFEVPEGVAEIEVQHDDLSETNILDWGVRDPERTRGWGGGNTEPAVIGVEAASRSYLPGPLPAGTWWIRIGEAKVVELPARYHVDVILRDAATLPPQPERSPYVSPGPLSRGARWYAGDLHVHSRESGDAEPTIDAIADFAAGEGLDFVELSDHNTTSQLELMNDAQTRHPDVLLVPGVEYTTYGGHANGIGATEWVDSAIGMPGVTIEGAAQAFADQGALFSINHPTLDLQDFCIGCAWSWDLPADRIDAIEISTGGWSRSGWLLAPSSMDLWDELSRQGHHVTAVGGSDDHRGGQGTGAFDSPLGSPTTMVRAEELSVEAIVAAIRAGRTVVKLEGPDDPMVELDWSVLPGGETGDTIAAPSVTLTVTVTDGGDRLLLTRNGEVVERIPIDSDPFVVDRVIEPPTTGEDFWRVVVIVDDAPRTVTSNVWLRWAEGPPPPEETSTGSARGGGCAIVGPAPGARIPLFLAPATALALVRRRGRGRRASGRDRVHDARVVGR